MPIVNPDWVAPIEMTFDEGKPIRSEQGLMLAGNPIAITLGKPNAPRNRPLSLDLMLGGTPFDLSGTTPVNFLDLAGLSSLILVGFAQGSVSDATPFQVGYSLNNGSTWTGYQTLFTAASGNATASGTFFIHLPSGNVNMAAFAGAAGANAIRVRKNLTGGNARVSVYGFGRT
jgi:hypothetical protein